MFLERLEMLLKEKGVTKYRALKEIGLNTSSFNDWKRRGTMPSGETLEKLAEYFEVSIDYLVGRSDDATPVKWVGPEEWYADPAENLMRSDGCLTPQGKRVGLAYDRAPERDRSIVEAVLDPYMKEGQS